MSERERTNILDIRHSLVSSFMYKLTYIIITYIKVTYIYYLFILLYLTYCINKLY